MTATPKVKFATVWLDGCSGCHMSFLDIDERLLELGDKIEVVYSPMVDNKDYPDGVDVCLVEGSVSTTADLEKIKHIRELTKTLVSLGGCAVSGNISAMRNPYPLAETLATAYGDQTPHIDIPALFEPVVPVHEVVPVEVMVPGCPPSNDTIFYVIEELLAGRTPDLKSRPKVKE